MGDDADSALSLSDVPMGDIDALARGSYPVSTPPPDKPPPDKPDPMATMLSDLRENYAQERRDLAELQRRRDAIHEREVEEERPLREALLKDLQRPRKEPPPVRELPEPPKFNFQKESQSWIGAAGIVALVMGAASRGHAINTLSTFAGFFDGLKQGQDRVAEESYREWEASVKKVQNQANQEIQRYKMVMENRAMDVSEKRAALKTVAAEYQNQLMYEAARQEDIMHAAQAYQTMVGNVAKFQETAAKLKEAHELHEQNRLAKQQELEIRRQGLEIQRQRYTGSMQPETISSIAERYRTMGPEALRGFPRTGPLYAQIQDEIATQMKANHETPEMLSVRWAEREGLKAGERVLGQRSAQFGMAVAEYGKIQPVLDGILDRINRGESLDLNRLFRAGRLRTGNTDEVRLGAALMALRNVYARAISPQGTPTVHDKVAAAETINESMSVGQLRAIIETFDLEMEAAKGSPGIVKQELRGLYGGATPNQSPIPKGRAFIDPDTLHEDVHP